MAFWRTVRTKDSCYKQQMQRGFVDGVWTTYAISGTYPCGSSILSGPPREPISGKPIKAQKRIINQNPNTMTDEQSAMYKEYAVSVAVVVIGVVIGMFLMQRFG